MMATAAAVAFIVISCKAKLAEADDIDLASTPLQTVENMFAVETDKGAVKMRIEAGLMHSFETDSTTYEIFPKGFRVYAYAEDGLLETLIYANSAKHIVSKYGNNPEIWQAFGNVVIQNFKKQETMTTDTLYWDQGKNEIWTDCYIKAYSPDGLTQGYGMRSDDRARNAILHKPFNSFLVTEKDTTIVLVDSANFIGPFKKK